MKFSRAEEMQIIITPYCFRQLSHDYFSLDPLFCAFGALVSLMSINEDLDLCTIPPLSPEL